MNPVLIPGLRALLSAALLIAPFDAFSAPQTWVRLDNNVVYFAPEADVKTELLHIGASDDYWEQLSVSISYEGASSERQAEEIRKAHPRFQVRRAVLTGVDEIAVTIPSIEVTERIKPMPGQEGPYVNYVRYLSKDQSAKLRFALAKREDLVRITGEVQAEFPMLKTVERVELDRGICSQFLAKGNTVFDAIRGYIEVRKHLDSMTFRFEATKTSLEGAALTQCLDLRLNKPIDSFGELLSQPMTLRETTGRLAGETRKEAANRVKTPLRYRLTQSDRGGSEP